MRLTLSYRCDDLIASNLSRVNVTIIIVFLFSFKFYFFIVDFIFVFKVTRLFFTQKRCNNGLFSNAFDTN